MVCPIVKTVSMSVVAMSADDFCAYLRVYTSVAPGHWQHFYFNVADSGISCLSNFSMGIPADIVVLLANFRRFVRQLSRRRTYSIYWDDLPSSVIFLYIASICVDTVLITFIIDYS